MHACQRAIAIESLPPVTPRGGRVGEEEACIYMCIHVHTSNHTCGKHNRSYCTIEDKDLHIHLFTHIGEGCMCNLYSLSIHTCMRAYNNGVHESNCYVYTDTYRYIPSNTQPHTPILYIHGYTPPPIHHFSTPLPPSLKKAF